MVTAVLQNEKSRSLTANRAGASSKLAATAAFSVAFILFFSGLMLMIVSYVSGTPFHGLDTIMLVTSFAAFIFGSHFLDKIEAKKRAERE